MGMWAELIAGRSINQQSVFERYTEAAKRVMYCARCEALCRGESVITVADILSGLSVEEATRAERVGSLKANSFYLRWLSGLPALPALNQGEDCKDQESEPQLEIDAKKTLAYAVMEADRDREYWIDSDHLLRGLLRFPNKAHFALLKTEVSLKAARIASRRDRKEFHPRETPSLKVIQYLIRKHLALWVPPILGIACYLYVLLQSIGMGMSPITR
jgi:ATP-dependent Clp protease ATP-binding subunit ClpC